MVFGFTFGVSFVSVSLLIFLIATSEKGVEIHDEAERASETLVKNLRGVSKSGVAFVGRLSSRPPAVV